MCPGGMPENVSNHEVDHVLCIHGSSMVEHASEAIVGLCVDPCTEAIDISAELIAECRGCGAGVVGEFAVPLEIAGDDLAGVVTEAVDGVPEVPHGGAVGGDIAPVGVGMQFDDACDGFPGVVNGGA